MNWFDWQSLAWRYGVIFGVVNLATFASLWVDKRLASYRRYRVPEIHLILLSLFGGWPAGMIAMHRMRHKTQKTTFRSKFYAAAALNVAAATYLILDPRTIDFLTKKFLQFFE